MKVNNPILTGFNADPSMIFVDPYYYIATSTFENYPGVQIHRSTDLVNWQVVTRPVDDSKIAMRGITPSCGVWAPALSYCEGIFYLVYSNVTLWTNAPFKDVCNYVITTSDVEGQWSKPTYVNSSGFDASIFHDDDGKSYFVNMEWDYRNPESDAFTGILLQEIDRKTLQLVGNPQTIFYGTDRKLVEGPHIYHKDDYYYLLTAEGGTELKHAATLARSKSILGEYELHPNKHIVTSYGHNCKLAKAGHASLCVNNKGQWYMAHLVGRPYVKDKCPLGRETAIQNIEWIDDWPYIASDSKDLSPETRQAPRDYFEISHPVTFQPKSSNILFDQSSLRLRWQSVRTDISHKYTASPDGTSIVLSGGASYMNTQEQSLLVYRQQDFVFECNTKLEFEPTCFQHLAGLVYRYNEHNQYLLLLSFDKGQYYLSIHSVIDNVSSIHNVAQLSQGIVYLRLRVNHDKGQFGYSLNNKTWLDVGHSIDVSTLGDETAVSQYHGNPCLGFTGAFVGIYCGDFQFNTKQATFSDFVYKSDSHK
jgi:xylan 1,4-beta-xylosidase